MNADARIERLRAALRSCASGLHNGSDIAPTASDDFHIGVPKEVAAYRRRVDEKIRWYENRIAEIERLSNPTLLRRRAEIAEARVRELEAERGGK